MISCAGVGDGGLRDCQDMQHVSSFSFLFLPRAMLSLCNFGYLTLW
jgi:hypothetical protein